VTKDPLSFKLHNIVTKHQEEMLAQTNVPDFDTLIPVSGINHSWQERLYLFDR